MKLLQPFQYFKTPPSQLVDYQALLKHKVLLFKSIGFTKQKRLFWKVKGPHLRDKRGTLAMRNA